MKLAHPQISSVFDFTENNINTVVIENSRFFRELVEDLTGQTSGASGKSVLSVDGRIIDFSKNAEIISQFVPFDINQKSLLSKIYTAIEKEAVNENYYLRTQELLQNMENYILDLAFVLPCDVYCSKLNIGNIIKSLGLLLQKENYSLIENLLDYMDLTCQLDREKLFVFINLRSYLDDEEMECFFKTAKKHDFKIFLVDNCEKRKLNFEKRLVIDEDLCEI